jgi:hypothetical protein
MHAPSIATHLFVEEWCRRVLNEDPTKLRSTESAKELIFNREAQIKGALARYDNRRSRELVEGRCWTRPVGFPLGRTRASFFVTLQRD